jgi:hypothetical protein
MRFLVGSKDSLAELSTSSPAMPQFKGGDSRGEPSHATVQALELDGRDGEACSEGSLNSNLFPRAQRY